MNCDKEKHAYSTKKRVKRNIEVGRERQKEDGGYQNVRSFYISFLCVSLLINSRFLL